MPSCCEAGEEGRNEVFACAVECGAEASTEVEGIEEALKGYNRRRFLRLEEELWIGYDGRLIGWRRRARGAGRCWQ